MDPLAVSLLGPLASACNVCAIGLVNLTASEDATKYWHAVGALVLIGVPLLDRKLEFHPCVGTLASG